MVLYYLTCGFLIFLLLFLSLILLPFVSPLLVKKIVKLCSLPTISLALKIIFIAIGLLFFEASYSLYKFETRNKIMKQQEVPPSQDTRNEFLRFRFRAQRNFYLSEMTFIIMIITWRIVSLLNSHETKLANEKRKLERDSLTSESEKEEKETKKEIKKEK
ncbi:hypothetical protein M0812_29378 [Anaeramoeba flamelloides]|uniref:BAP29/BAP31 transmembrane domain-containing protein n=1 Tax=Anaeramoeba flamelloides TaxID=1746091 RepID=A0AAV7Y732_9EUKA|nr:hypothetical protein M0812_29378 [Anaeramoeba flamelloides]